MSINALRMVAQLDATAEPLGEHGRAVLPFVGIGLALGLIAALTGVQGVWL